MYARAFADVYEAAPENVRNMFTKRLFDVIDKNGDRSRAERIIREIERFITKKQGGREVQLEFARPVPLALINELKKRFRTVDRIDVSVNTSLVAGVRIVIDGERELDNSMARKLKDMFKKEL